MRHSPFCRCGRFFLTQTRLVEHVENALDMGHALMPEGWKPDTDAHK